jgi:hypothetical protein
VNSARLRSWILPAIACAAMLVAPMLSWLLIPRPAIFVLPAAAPGAAPEGPQSAQASTVAPLPHDTPARVLHVSRPDTSAQPVGVVEGVVLDPDAHPAKGASVTCEDRDPPLATTTDDDGRFHLDADAAGCHAVARRADLFPSDPITLVAGSGNTLRFARGGGIEGVVVDERGGPVPSYLLAVESYVGPATARVPTGQTKTLQDPRGAFAWSDIPAGRYMLTASSEGRPPARSGPIDVESGRTTAHVRITLGRGATLSGRILDAITRRPISGATITLDALTQTAAQAVKPARSDDQGSFSLEGAPSGPFSVRVTRDGYRTRIVTGLTTNGASTLQRDIELNPLVDGGPAGEDFAGIGAFLEASPKGIAFNRLVPGGPAEKAGVQPGDVIRRIDGADASSLALVDCMQSLRGPDGTRVTVQVERAGQRMDITIQRRALTL